MVSRYVDRPRRALLEVLQARIEPGDTVEHPSFGTGRVSLLLTPAEGENRAAYAEALVRFDDGRPRLVALHHLTKLLGEPS